MTAKIIDGKAIALLVRAEIAEQAKEFLDRHGRQPGLAVVLVGANPASQVYVRNKRVACEKAGVASFNYDLPAEASEEKLLELIEQLNAREDVDGILVQLPLPDHMDKQAVIEAIRPDKDVDGFHPYNIGRLAQGSPALRPCTPFGVMRMLDETGIQLRGMEAVVVGASNIVGRPMAFELMRAGATVTVCNSKTRDLPAHVRKADLVVAAVGSPGLLRGDWFHPEAVVIDVGINRLPDGKLAGDVLFAEAVTQVSWITPVPGGVGPMTVAMLLHNTLQAANMRVDMGEHWTPE